MTDFPITPPPELVREWFLEATDLPTNQWVTDVAARAANWGADQELEACCEYLKNNELCDPFFYKVFRAARRSKPPSLVEEALAAARIELSPTGKNGALILKALERLQELEGGK